MPQVRRGLDFVQKPFGAQRLGQLGGKHLDRHVALMSQIPRGVHGGHATLAKYSRDDVAALERRVEPGGGGIHGGQHARGMHFALASSANMRRRGGGARNCRPETRIRSLVPGKVSLTSL